MHIVSYFGSLVFRMYMIGGLYASLCISFEVNIGWMCHPMRKKNISWGWNLTCKSSLKKSACESLCLCPVSHVLCSQWEKSLLSLLPSLVSAAQSLSLQSQFTNRHKKVIKRTKKWCQSNDGWLSKKKSKIKVTYFFLMVSCTDPFRKLDSQ